MNGRSDEFFTPKYALKPLLPFLKKNWTIWECAWGKGALATHLREEGFEVIGESYKDFLNEDFGLDTRGFDVIVTNPPYSKKDEFLKRAFDIGKPFALLMANTWLNDRAPMQLFEERGLQLLLLDRRTEFIQPDREVSGKITFSSSYFCCDFLPRDIIIKRIER